MPEFEIIDALETPYLFVAKSCSMEPEDISKNMGEAFQQVWGFMQGEGIQPAGGALSVYYEYHPDKMVFRAGFTIAAEDMDKAKGEVEVGVTPAGEVLYFVHKGPYSTLRDDYGIMMEHIGKIGREIAAPTWEVYLNDPSQVSEDELLTDVFTALK